MDPHAIVAKTSKGEEEIQSRKHGLERQHRHVLILVDGKTTLRQLMEEKGAALPHVEESLLFLASRGFVSLDGVVTDNPMDETACTVLANQDILALKAALVAAAREILGDDGGSIVSRLEAAPDTITGLQETINNCKKVVYLLIDENKASQLLQRCQDLISQHGF